MGEGLCEQAVGGDDLLAGRIRPACRRRLGAIARLVAAAVVGGLGVAPQERGQV